MSETTKIVQVPVEMVAIGDIKPAKYNPRADLQPTDPRYQKIDAALERFGMVEVLVWNKRSGNLVGGHQRLKMLADDGHEEVQVSVVDLDEEDEKALNLALNRLGGDWDEARLAEVLNDLEGIEDFEIELTGFSDAEVEDILDRHGYYDDADEDGEDDDEEDDDDPPSDDNRFDLAEHPAVETGDVFVLGGIHRFACGDCRDEGLVRAVLGHDDPCPLMLTDPPYCSGSNQEAGKSAGTWGDIASDNLSTRGYTALMTAAMIAARPQTVYAFTDWRMWTTLYDVAESSGLLARAMVVWDKGHPGLGALWRTQHELILYASREGISRRKGCASVGNVITCKRTGNRHHYTQKPIKLLRTLLQNDGTSKKRGPDTQVYDPFAGSGSTMLAAEADGRPSASIECEPAWCHKAIERFINRTGKPVILEETGETWAEVVARRTPEE